MSYYSISFRYTNSFFIMGQIILFLFISSNLKMICIYIICLCVNILFLKYNISLKMFDKNSLNDRFIKYLTTGNKYWIKYAVWILMGQYNSLIKLEYNMSKILNILQIIAVSGFHIGILNFIIKKCLSLLRVNHIKFISIIILSIYSVAINAPIPISRAIIFLISKSMLDSKKVKNSKNISCCVSILAVLFLFKESIEKIQFILTVLASSIVFLTIECCDNIANKNIKKILQFFLIYIGISIYSSYINGFISITGMFTYILMTPIFIFIYSTSVVLIPFKNLLNQEYFLLEQTIHFVFKITYNLKISFISNNLLFIYYIIFIICILFMERKIFLLKMK